MSIFTFSPKMFELTSQSQTFLHIPQLGFPQVGYQYQGGQPQHSSEQQVGKVQQGKEREGQFTQGLGWEHFYTSNGNSS